MANFLEQSFPELRGRIEGENYPPPPLAEVLSNVLSVLQFMALLYMFFGGERVLRMIGYRAIPPWFGTVQNNSLQIGMALFLVLPQILSKWMITGAFEIYLDGSKVWSKLDAGRFPEKDEIISALSALGLQKRA